MVRGSNPLCHQDWESLFEETRHLSAILTMPITNAKVVSEVAIIEVRNENKRVLVYFIRIIRNHANTSSKRVFRDYIPFNESGLGSFARRSRSGLGFVVEIRRRLLILVW